MKNLNKIKVRLKGSDGEVEIQYEHDLLDRESFTLQSVTNEALRAYCRLEKEDDE